MITWLLRPRNPLDGKETHGELLLLAVSLGYETGQLMLGGRTLGQRALGLRTVAWRDGSQPGWRTLLRRGAVLVVWRSLPRGVLWALLPARWAWMAMRPERTWRQVLTGVVVVDDDAVTVSRHR